MPLPREIRRKLSALGRPKQAAERDEAAERAKEPEAPEQPPSSVDASVGRVSRRLLKDRLQERFGDRQPEGEPDFGPARAIEDVLPGEEVENEFGLVYLARTPAAVVCDTQRLEERLVTALGRPDLASADAELGALAGADPAKVVFLDTETTGLASVPLFLCGVMHRGPDGLVIEQMLARDYAEEPALLRHVQSILETADALVTYNGRTFDLPFIHERMVYHLLDYRYEGGHADLLPSARRLYRGVFPDCKLQTLEVRLCGFPVRADDIPGDQIPQAYHDFVATSNAGILAPIFRHNARDLVVLCEVLVRMVEGSRD